jgi:hypothetical protein
MAKDSKEDLSANSFHQLSPLTRWLTKYNNGVLLQSVQLGTSRSRYSFPWRWVVTCGVHGDVWCVKRSSV